MTRIIGRSMRMLLDGVSVREEGEVSGGDFFEGDFVKNG